MDFSFVIANVLSPKAESIFFWWRIIAIITIGAAYCFDEKDNIYKFKWYDYFVLGGILCAFIFIYHTLNSGLTLISGLLAVYALFYSTMSANYSARKIVINSWAEKAIDHLRQYKDSDLAVQVARMQLVDKPNYFKVRDVLWYRSNKQELAEKNLDVIYENGKLVIEIADKIIYGNYKLDKNGNYNKIDVKIFGAKIIPESEYMVGKKIEWIKIYAKLDIEQYAVELIKKEFEVMAKNKHFAGKKIGDKWKNDADLRKLWLHGADLSYSELQGADLRDAHLQGADLSEAHLQGACLIFANLQGTNLKGTKLQGANIAANLKGVFIQQCRNLESNIDINILLTDAILEETDKYKDDLPDFTGVKCIDSAIFSDDDEDTNKKVIAKIKQMYKL